MKRSRSVFPIFIVIISGFIVSTIVSIWSLSSLARENTKEINTMLTYRIYEELSGSLDEPVTVSRSMAGNKLVLDFLKNEDRYTEDEAVAFMQEYLARVKDMYGYDTVNVISDKSRRYYTNVGLNKVIDVENDAHDIWYKNFVDRNQKYYLNVDTDEVNHGQWTVFVDVRIEDDDGTLLGVCSVGVKMMNLRALFISYEYDYNVAVKMVDDTGLVQVDTDEKNIEKLYLDTASLTPARTAEYVLLESGSGDFTVTKYVSQLGWYLVVQSGSTGISDEFMRTILINSALSILVALILLSSIGIILRQERRRNAVVETMNGQLSSVVDIYRSAHDLDIINDTFSEIRTNERSISDTIGNNRENAQATLYSVMDKLTAPSSKEDIMKFIDFSTVDERMSNSKTITIEFLNVQNMWLRGRFIVSQRTEEGRISHILWMVEDIDKEKRRRDMMLMALNNLTEQMSSVANIFTMLYDIDIPGNSFSEVRTSLRAMSLSDLVGGNSGDAQAIMFDTMKKMTDKSHRLRMREFITFRTLDMRLSDTDMITLEFLGYNDEWQRARFVVTERLPDGKVSHVLWLVESIDAEKRASDAIAMEATNLNAQITSVANIYMSMFDIDLKADTFRTIKCDNAIVKTLIDDNTTDAQLLMFDVMEHITDDSSMEEVKKFINFGTLGVRLKNTEAVTLEFLTVTKKWIRSRFIVSQRTYTGELSHVMWLAEDIDDEKKERDKLIDMSERALAASEAKSSFLSNMSHEIRTPINAVLGMNEMILRECDDNNILAYSESIRTAGNTLLGIINDILDFSKIEAGKMEIIPVDYDISSVINDLVNMIQTRADDKGLVLVLDINKEVPKLLHGDEVRLKQVITNILTNAVKYTEKGSVTFCISYSKIADEPDSVMLEVAVKDTGIGIKPEDMKKLFSEFERIEEERNRNVEGTGLGMNITQRLLQMMGSQLKVESVYGLGSKFSFILKQKVVKWEALGDYEASYKASLKEHKKYREKFTAPDAEVLVVDDTPMNLMVFKSLLKQTGVKIDTAACGDEGLAYMAGKKYDIIFLDHMMPEKDGIETLHELRGKSNDPNVETPVICLTANAISGAREQYLAEGFNDYLTKPIDSAKLEEMLLEYLPKYKIHDPANDIEDGSNIAFDDEPKLPEFLEHIGEINTAAGITNCGSVDGYIGALKTYADMIGDHADETEKYWNDGDIANATIKIHAMKSTSRIIGAVDIGEFAQSLENAGKAGDARTLGAHIGELLERCRALGEQLSPLLDKPEETEDESLPLISEEELQEAYALIKEASEAFRFDNINEIAESLKDYRIPDTEKERVKSIIKAVDDLEYDKLPEILS